MKAFAIRWLKPSHRRGAGAAQPRRAGLAAQALSGRILQRYELRRQPRRGLGLEYLHANQLDGLPQALRMSLLLSQRLDRAARPSLEMRLPPAAPSLAQTAAAPPLGSPALALRQAPYPPEPARLHMTYLQSLNRLQVANHTRLELSPGRFPVPAAQPLPASAALPMQQPVPLIARPSPTPGAPGSANNVEPDAASRQMSAAQSSAQAVERAAAGLPPAELRRVTEQVIQEIDRRIIANRERFGRT